MTSRQGKGHQTSFKTTPCLAQSVSGERRGSLVGRDLEVGKVLALSTSRWVRWELPGHRGQEKAVEVSQQA